MKEKMDFAEEYTLPEAPWIDISIKVENMAVFETFCDRNRIPFEVTDSTEEAVICSVRDGMDVKDAMAYMLRMTLNPEDKETCECVYLLFLMRNAWCPEYDYEWCIYRNPEDELLLSQCPEFR